MKQEPVPVVPYPLAPSFMRDWGWSVVREKAV